ncbi:MAG: DUF429 domain-containing protein [Sandaracinaceae bacterium]|nr:DUF429 domain-containing protein [Sandaracinaceae bacterium]
MIPVLAIGWDVGGWLGTKQGVAVLLHEGPGRAKFLSAPRRVRAAEIEARGLDGFLGGALGASTGDVCERFRVVLAIDAPLGFPRAFGELLAGRPPKDPNPSREIDSTLAHRSCDRWVYEKHGKKPLSASFDKLGNNATVAMVVTGRLRAERAFRALPFDAPQPGCPELIEVYPALVKRDGHALAPLARWLPREIEPGTDEHDAAICAVLGLAHACAGAEPDLPELVPPPADLLEDARDEGWIYSPAPEWIARAASTRRGRPRRR